MKIQAMPKIESYNDSLEAIAGLAILMEFSSEKPDLLDYLKEVHKENPKSLLWAAYLAGKQYGYVQALGLNKMN